VKPCESSISSRLVQTSLLTTTTLAALENSSRVIRAYLAYYGLLGLMGFTRADYELLQVIRGVTVARVALVWLLGSCKAEHRKDNARTLVGRPREYIYLHAILGSKI
jgi:hypothetical protein